MNTTLFKPNLNDIAYWIEREFLRRTEPSCGVFLLLVYCFYYNQITTKNLVYKSSTRRLNEQMYNNCLLIYQPIVLNNLNARPSLIVSNMFQTDIPIHNITSSERSFLRNSLLQHKADILYQRINV